MNQTITTTDIDFEILETSEATAMEEMGASSGISASSSCSSCDKKPAASPQAN
jgi:thiazolylpeptide-type bacteriocin precursor